MPIRLGVIVCAAVVVVVADCPRQERRPAYFYIFLSIRIINIDQAGTLFVYIVCQAGVIIKTHRPHQSPRRPPTKDIESVFVHVHQRQDGGLVDSTPF